MTGSTSKWRAVIAFGLFAGNWALAPLPAAAATIARPAPVETSSRPVIMAQGDFREIMRGVQRREEWRNRGGPRYQDRRYDRDRRWERDRRRYERDRWERRGPPSAYRGLSSHQVACSRRYRTYDPRTNTYFIRPGVRAVCR